MHIMLAGRFLKMVSLQGVNMVFAAFIATLFTWLMTALGSATVFLFKRVNPKILNTMMGFAAGVMIAASFWSLLQPAIERAEKSALPHWLIPTIGFISGAVFLWMSDKIVTAARQRLRSDKEISHRATRIIMLIFSITLHNIPEGLAVGVAFGALNNGTASTVEVMSAASVAVGIGLQNFPEGATVSIPLRREGYSRTKSFLYGQASGMVEPIAAVMGAVAVTYIEALLPFALSFAAGAMILVAVHELIPECQSTRNVHPYVSTMGIIVGFSLMMLLDITL